MFAYLEDWIQRVHPQGNTMLAREKVEKNSVRNLFTFQIKDKKHQILVRQVLTYQMCVYIEAKDFVYSIDLSQSFHITKEYGPHSHVAACTTCSLAGSPLQKRVCGNEIKKNPTGFFNENEEDEEEHVEEDPEVAVDAADDDERWVSLFEPPLKKELTSVDQLKKYSSGLSSQLTLQDSIGEILQDSNGVLEVVVGAVKLLEASNDLPLSSSKDLFWVVMVFWRRFWTILSLGVENGLGNERSLRVGRRRQRTFKKVELLFLLFTNSIVFDDLDIFGLKFSKFFLFRTKESAQLVVAII
ncbi:hypothetical protein V2J09_012049 [Rumex salicifolius]